MKSLSMAVVAMAAVVVSAAADSGILPHVLYGKRLAGQVVDAETGQPIAGAHVAFVWESGITPSGFTGHNSRDICYHAAATVTDSAGRFQIEPWRKWSTYDVHIWDPIALVYARKYVPRQIYLKQGTATPPVDRPNERFTLARFTGSVDTRLDQMWGGIANRGCMYGGDSQKSLYPMLRSIYEEAREIARSPSQVEQLRSFALEAGYAALAFDPNGPGHDKELKAFIEENLK